MLISKFDITDIAEKIDTFEKEHEIVFPMEYRNFMLRYNGGETPKTSFRSNRKTYQLRAFFGIELQAGNYSLNDVHYIDNFIKRGVLPIAVDYFGNYYAVSLNGETCGSVYFLNHESNYKEKMLFNSFNELISASKSEKIGYIPTIEERKQKLIANGFGHTLSPEKLAGWQAEIDRYKDINQEEVIL